MMEGGRAMGVFDDDVCDGRSFFMMGCGGAEGSGSTCGGYRCAFRRRTAGRR